MSVMAYPTSTVGGIIMDLDNLVDDNDSSLKLLTLDEATNLCNQLKRSIIEATLAIDPDSRIRHHLDRVFA